MILFGTNPIAWSNDDDRRIGADITLAQCLDDAASIGFDGIEKGHKFPVDPGALKAELAPRNLRFVSGWHSLNLLTRSVADERKALQPHIELLTAMDCSVCIVCETSNAVHGRDDIPVNDKPVLSDDQWVRFGEHVEEIAEHCESQGLTLVYHHHAGTIVETAAEIDRFMAVTGPKTKLLFDVGHCVFGGGDPFNVMQRHADRIAHLHVKNVRMPVMREVRAQGLSFLEGVRRGVFTVPGDSEGGIDFDPILKLASARGYSGWIVIEAEQDPQHRNPFEYQSLGLRSIKLSARTAGLIREA